MDEKEYGRMEASIVLRMRIEQEIRYFEVSVGRGRVGLNRNINSIF